MGSLEHAERTWKTVNSLTNERKRWGRSSVQGRHSWQKELYWSSLSVLTDMVLSLGQYLQFHCSLFTENVVPGKLVELRGGCAFKLPTLKYLQLVISPP